LANKSIVVDGIRVELSADSVQHRVWRILAAETVEIKLYDVTYTPAITPIHSLDDTAQADNLFVDTTRLRNKLWLPRMIISK
jgi:hypothetical protein